MEDRTLEYLSANLSFWDNLSEQQKQYALQNTSRHSYQAGQSIHGEERECVGLICIVSGSIRIYILSEDGRDVTLYRLGVGDICILSASCILGSINFDVHIDAEVDTEVMLVSAPAVARLSADNIYVENFTNKLTAQRFSDVMWTIEQILFMSFDKRLAIFLLDESVRLGSDRIILTHELIARYMGSAREVVSRMLKYFEGEGLVSLHRGEVRLLDKKRLRSMTM